jgi:hypothetical protein
MPLLFGTFCAPPNGIRPLILAGCQNHTVHELLKLELDLRR